MSLPYQGKLISLAKNLRKSMTQEERKLWYQFLKNYPIRFQRQKTIGNYIADFYCSKANLVIELDGSQHYSDIGMEKDIKRTKILEKSNVMVLRFSNADVKNNFYGVCTVIDETVKKRV